MPVATFHTVGVVPVRTARNFDGEDGKVCGEKQRLGRAFSLAVHDFPRYHLRGDPWAALCLLSWRSRRRRRLRHGLGLASASPRAKFDPVWRVTDIGTCSRQRCSCGPQTHAGRSSHRVHVETCTTRTSICLRTMCDALRGTGRAVSGRESPSHRASPPRLTHTQAKCGQYDPNLCMQTIWRPAIARPHRDVPLHKLLRKAHDGIDERSLSHRS